MSGAITVSGYGGFRPGEKADPYIEGKIVKPDSLTMTPFMADPREKSMAARIAHRRLRRSVGNERF